MAKEFFKFLGIAVAVIGAVAVINKVAMIVGPPSPTPPGGLEEVAARKERTLKTS
jgi:hypothetical protein